MKYTINYAELFKTIFNEAAEVGKYYKYFYNYSFANTILLYFQGVRSPVGTFKKWVQQGRSVKKGSKAKLIYFPAKLEKEKIDAKTGETVKVEYITYVLKPCLFALDDTDGNGDLYDEDTQLPGFDKVKLFQQLGITETKYHNVSGNIQGYSIPDDNTIAINPLVAYPIKTILHETAHCLLHKVEAATFSHPNDLLSDDIKEVEAESVAYIVGSFMNVISEEAKIFSRGYIQSWLQNQALEERTIKRIFFAVDKIIKALK